LDTIKTGRELVTSFALQVYQLASVSAAAVPDKKPAAAPSAANDVITANLPIPVLVMNKDQVVVFANNAAGAYLGLNASDVMGKNMYSVLDMSFPTENTFDSWLALCRKEKVTATMTWDRVRLQNKQEANKQFDLVAYYNKNNPSGFETIIALFDQTNAYNQQDEAVGFVALAVHELRTPLTMLRGYIEVLQEELAGKLNPELDDYVQKMQASAQQLAAFVSNILNVARVEENQLFLQLKEEQWEPVLKSSTADMELRARVHGKRIMYQIQPNLPTVGVDRTTIYEVVNNLIDNAIKYSGKSTDIIVKSYLGQDGFVETLVQDFGIGIPSNIMDNLFEKFYRNHRSRAQIGGTGLGLYLSKAIVKAHGGQIWVQSKEGEGSTFGFSLVPYVKLAEGLKNTDNRDMTRTAHGWIKNHSFYRR
jgi:signal transduction histidine kinase